MFRKIEIEILPDKFGSDSRGFINHRQTTSGMRASTNQVNSIKILETVLRPSMQHLPEVMSQIKGRSQVNLMPSVPISGSADLLVPDPPLDVGDAEFF